MTNYPQITSAANSKIKTILALQQKSKTRKQTGLFVVEGLREINLALKHHYVIESLFFVKNLVPEVDKYNCPNTIEISAEVYQKMAYREATEGLMAIMKQKNHQLNDLVLPDNPLILIMQGIEKPGNVGAMLRTADAAKVDAVILADPLSDLYNPNTIRSSVGGLFTNKIAVATSQETLQFLSQKNITPYAATLQNSNPYAVHNYTQPTAFVLGAEAHGLTEIWRQTSIAAINIPMLGSVDSMNVSVAAGILLYEAVRQRNLRP